MVMLITNEQAGRIVATNKRLGDLRNNLSKLAEARSVEVKAEVRFGSSHENALFTKNKKVIGIIRREQELAIAECIRELNRLGAEVPPC